MCEDRFMGIETIEVGNMIRLGQFLKFAGLAESGAHARDLIAAGDVQVDGRVETHRGHQLHPGAVVTVQIEATQVSVQVG